MKKILTVFVTLLVLGIFGSTALAQYEKDKSTVGPRVGLGYNGSGLSFGAGYEYGITPEISVGGLFDYYTWSYDAGFGGGKYTYIVVGAQGNYHFGKLLKWDAKLDPFAGLVLAYENVSWSWNNGTSYAGYSPSASGIVLGAQAGIRYFLSPTWALYGQVGFGITYLKVGVDFKF